MRARFGRHRHRRHSGQFLEPVRQLCNQRDRTLHRSLRLKRMNVGKTRKSRKLLTKPRVMLHRARTERIKAGVDRGIELRKPYIVADRLRLGQSWNPDWLSPVQTVETI